MANVTKDTAKRGEHIAGPSISRAEKQFKTVTLLESGGPSDDEIKKCRLPAIALATLKKHFADDDDKQSLAKFAEAFSVPPLFKKRAGLFVTFSRDGKTRACWGNLDGRYENLVKATVFTTEEALTDEYRYKKVTAEEVNLMHAQVTVVTRVAPLHSLGEQNPRQCGMLVRSGTKSGVILPGEATDPYYQLVQCKLKAGIKHNEPCQIYRIKADVYR